MSDKPDLLRNLSDQIDSSQRSLPPVEKWNPPLSGELDLCIKRDGTWLHEGSPILRKELVNLFSTILKREGDEFFLVTPVEKWRIKVEDAPLHAVALQQIEVDGKPALQFETLTGDVVIADAVHPIRVDIDPASDEPSPYVRVRSNLDALIARNVFYQMVDHAQVDNVGSVSRLYASSAGQRFLLGTF